MSWYSSVNENAVAHASALPVRRFRICDNFSYPWKLQEKYTEHCSRKFLHRSGSPLCFSGREVTGGLCRMLVMVCESCCILALISGSLYSWFFSSCFQVLATWSQLGNAASMIKARYSVREDVETHANAYKSRGLLITARKQIQNINPKGKVIIRQGQMMYKQQW